MDYYPRNSIPESSVRKMSERMRWYKLGPVDLLTLEGTRLDGGDNWDLYALTCGGACIVMREGASNGSARGLAILGGLPVQQVPDTPLESQVYTIEKLAEVIFYGRVFRIHFTPPGEPMRHDFGLYQLGEGGYLGWTSWNGRGVCYSEARVFSAGHEFVAWNCKMPEEFVRLWSSRRWYKTPPVNV